MAAQLGWQQAKISKIENGRQWPSADDIRAWAAVCGAPGQASELTDLLATARSRHRQWRHRIRGGQAAIQSSWESSVRQARSVRWFEVTLIPGLLQTPGYTRAIVEENIREYGFPADQAEADVAARMHGRDVLYEDGREFRFVLSEAALRIRVAPEDVMAGQLVRLMDMAELPGVTLGIIPFATQVAVTPVHGFVILDDEVIYETYASGVNVYAEEAAVYPGVFDRLAAEAVTGDDAAVLVRDAIAALRK
jgi:transcriptional regulator with XRE-family HTH domain